MDRTKVYRRISTVVWIVFIVLTLMGKVIFGAAICFSSMGILFLLAAYHNLEPLGFSISGFNYALKQMLKEYHNRYFNGFWGIIFLIVGIAAGVKILG